MLLCETEKLPFPVMLDAVGACPISSADAGAATASPPPISANVMAAVVSPRPMRVLMNRRVLVSDSGAFCTSALPGGRRTGCGQSGQNPLVGASAELPVTQRDIARSEQTRGTDPPRRNLSQ